MYIMMMMAMMMAMMMKMMMIILSTDIVHFVVHVVRGRVARVFLPCPRVVVLQVVRHVLRHHCVKLTETVTGTLWCVFSAINTSNSDTTASNSLKQLQAHCGVYSLPLILQILTPLRQTH